jgi:hypothetical protein
MQRGTWCEYERAEQDWLGAGGRKLFCILIVKITWIYTFLKLKNYIYNALILMIFLKS